MKTTTRVVQVLMFLVVMSLISCGPAERTEADQQTVVLPANEVHEGWYFAAGNSVTVEGTVNGDAYIAGGLVEIDGTVNGQLVVAGGQVNISGTISDRIYAAGGSVRLTGKTGKSVVVTGGTVTLGNEALVGDNLLAAAGTVHMGGAVEHAAKVAAGDVQILGTVKGNLDVSAERIEVRKGASVGGSLTVATKDSAGVSIAQGTVQGKTIITRGKHEPRATILGMGKGAFWVKFLFALSLFATALVLAFAMPKQLMSMGTLVIHKPIESLLWGIGILILTPIAAGVLIITVVGAPLGFFVFVAYLWFLYLSQLCLGAALGHKLLGFEGKRSWGIFLAIALGLLIIEILTFIPFVKVFIILAGLVFGLGALGLMAAREYTTLRSR